MERWKDSMQDKNANLLAIVKNQHQVWEKSRTNLRNFVQDQMNLLKDTSLPFFPNVQLLATHAPVQPQPRVPPHPPIPSLPIRPHPPIPPQPQTRKRVDVEMTERPEEKNDQPGASEMENVDSDHSDDIIFTGSKWQMNPPIKQYSNVFCKTKFLLLGETVHFESRTALKEQLERKLLSF